MIFFQNLKQADSIKTYENDLLDEIKSAHIYEEKKEMQMICPKCSKENVYDDGSMLVCPDCNHEWVEGAEEGTSDESSAVKDAHGNVLEDGDSVTLIKDLKVKGYPKPIKQGTKVKSIRLVEGDHNIDCKVDGFGGMKLKSEFVKKA